MLVNCIVKPAPGILVAKAEPFRTTHHLPILDNARNALSYKQSPHIMSPCRTHTYCTRVQLCARTFMYQPASFGDCHAQEAIYMRSRTAECADRVAVGYKSILQVESNQGSEGSCFLRPPNYCLLASVTIPSPLSC